MRLTGLFEDLDDQDTFGNPAISDAYVNKANGHQHLVILYQDGAQAYAHILPSNMGGDAFWKFIDTEGKLFKFGNEYSVYPAHWSAYENAIWEYRNSWYKDFTPEIWTKWKQAFGML